MTFVTRKSGSSYYKSSPKVQKSPWEYWYQSLSKTTQAYDLTRRECLPVTSVFLQLRQRLEGSWNTIQMDQDAPRCIRNMTNKRGKQERDAYDCRGSTLRWSTRLAYGIRKPKRFADCRRPNGPVSTRRQCTSDHDALRSMRCRNESNKRKGLAVFPIMKVLTPSNPLCQGFHKRQKEPAKSIARGKQSCYRTGE